MSKDSDITNPPGQFRAEPDTLLQSAIDCYWQEDAEGRCIFLRLLRGSEGLHELNQRLPCSTLEQAGLRLTGDAESQAAYHHARKEKIAFHNVHFHQLSDPGRQLRTFELSGTPCRKNGQFLGYDCVARDITTQRENARHMERFRAAIDLSMDMIFLVDPETLRFIDFNERACEANDLSREQLLQKGPEELLGIGSDELKARYAQLMSSGGSSRIERTVQLQDGSERLVEVHSRAAQIDGQWIIIGISRDITGRKQAETEAIRLQQMLSALSETNEAILRAESIPHLFEEVCQAVVKGGRFSIASIVQLQETGHTLHSVARAGLHADFIDTVHLSIRADDRHGRGIVGKAWRSRQPVIRNEYRADPDSLPWQALAETYDVRSGAAFPLFQRGEIVALLLFYAQETGVFDAEIERLLVSVVENISYALDSFVGDEERRLAEKLIRESEARFRSLTYLSSDFFWEMDSHLCFKTYKGPVRGESNRRAVEQVPGSRIWDLPWITPDSMSWEQLRKLLQARQTFRDFEFSFRNDAGELYHFALSGEAVFDDDGAFSGYRGISRDITEKKQIARHIEHLATHDALTGLPNRVMFSEILNHAIRSADRYPEQRFAVLFIDLDRFKLVNDNYGHHVGDELLRNVAVRLRQPLRQSDVLARLGGDEFVLLLQRIDASEKAMSIAKNILALFETPILLHGRECDISASIGISLYGEDAHDESSLMRHADAAMYAAKDQGRNNAQLYAIDVHYRTRERAEMESELRHALDRNELSLEYQAKLDLHDNRICGVEALLRWSSPALGQVTPDRFIPVAEESGLILKIGEWVLQNACQQMLEWQARGIEDLQLAVNLSARQFNDPDLGGKILQVLQTTGFPAQRLELEITESTVMRNPERSMAVMADLRRMGIRIAMDDFGTGYSSLGQLRDYPLDTIKIDRRFVSELSWNCEDQAICRAIITMGKTLSLTVVAEGVEFADQLTILREHGCDQIQGFHFHRPQPGGHFPDFHHQHQSGKHSR